MADIINLRTRRKAQRRLEREKAAEANRQRHGRTKIERAAAEQGQARAESLLDGHRLERPERPGD